MTGITIVYRGENGPGWVPKSLRDLWNYAVRTGQVVLPSADNGGPFDRTPLQEGDTVQVGWVPPEYAGRLREVPPPPQPTHFTLDDTTGMNPVTTEGSDDE